MSNAVAAAPVLPPRSAAADLVSPRTRLLLEGRIFPTLLGLALPNFLNLFSIAGLITFDGIFVGRLGTDALAGVSLVFPFVIALQHLSASGMGGAVSSAVARAIGAGTMDRANALATHAFALALGLAVIASGVMLTSGPVVYRWMGGRGEMLDAALTYSTVAFAGAVSICMLNILASVVRGTGNMMFPAAALMGGVLGHVLLSPMLIFGWGPFPTLGVAGAGLGLVISFGAASMVLFFYLRSDKSLVKLSLAGVRYRWAPFREFFSVGIPGMVNVAITNVTVVVLMAVTGHLGREAQIGYALGARLEYVIIPLAFVFGTALVSMVGTNWGAKQYQRSRRISWTGGAIAGAACGAVGLFFGVFPELWMGLFTGQDEVLRVGTLYLHIVAPVYAAYGFGQALYFSSQGFGNPLPAVLANVVRLLVSAGGGLAAVFWFGAGPPGVFAGIACGFITYAVLNAWILLRNTDPKTALQ